MGAGTVGATRTTSLCTQPAPRQQLCREGSQGRDVLMKNSEWPRVGETGTETLARGCRGARHTERLAWPQDPPHPVGATRFSQTEPALQPRHGASHTRKACGLRGDVAGAAGGRKSTREPRAHPARTAGPCQAPRVVPGASGGSAWAPERAGTSRRCRSCTCQHPPNGGRRGRKGSWAGCAQGRPAQLCPPMRHSLGDPAAMGGSADASTHCWAGPGAGAATVLPPVMKRWLALCCCGVAGPT